MKRLSTAETRATFLSFFEGRGHQRVRSSSLIPADDPTLLFTNAGMNQFKDTFLGREPRDYVRAASCQKCVRAGGKHNDFENVGATARHLTFFEMLGNFSFGDYFKREAIGHAWELLIGELGLPLERLWFSVYEDDDEAFEHWRSVGAPMDRILRFGEKDNFWSMGETGPCGPCSEIHYYRGASGGGTPDLVNGPGDDTIEIWNLVFMQYDRDASGRMSALPKPSVDTGAGLERLAMVLQGAATVFDADLLASLVAAASRIVGVPYGSDSRHDVSLRVLADHARSVSFLLADGALPGNEGRGSVLRRILRRALRHGKLLGTEGAFFARVCAEVIGAMGDAYPELAERGPFVLEVVESEEDRFERTLSSGLARLESWIAANRSARVVPGAVLFELHDTFGFPLDLAEEVVTLDHGRQVDRAGFDGQMEEQRRRARASWKGGKSLEARSVYGEAVGSARTEFVGYDRLAVEESPVVAVFQHGRAVERLDAAAGGEAELVLAVTPFYAQGGGQVGDTGLLRGTDLDAEVLDTLPAGDGIILHRVRLRAGRVQPGDRLRGQVDTVRRRAVMRNHTSTHLLHAALRQTLGPHVKQAGSLVAPDRLRFDFTHFAGVDGKTMQEIESLVNEQILADGPVDHERLPIDEALRRGAMALFGEKYGDVVRTCRIGDFSFELCGGTHVGRTGEIGAMKLVAERSVASGVRRVEAQSGTGALDRFRDAEEILARLESELNVTRDKLGDELARLRDRERTLERELRAVVQKGLTDGAGEGETREVRGVKVRTRLVRDVDPKMLRDLSDRLRDELGSGIVVLGSASEGKAQLVVSLTKDLVASSAGKLDAGRIVKELAPIIGARGGGGRADFAQSGGKEPERLGEALSAAAGVVERLLG